MTAVVSSTAEFNFGDKYRNTFRVSTLEPNRDVEFECLAGDREWIGTRLSFDRRPHRDGTTLSFAHRDWKERTEFFASCDRHRAHYTTSLKDYVETGQGTPHQKRQY